MRFLNFVAACWAGAAQAQSVAEDVDVQSAAGLIEIVDSSDGGSREVRVGAQRFFTDGDFWHVGLEAQLGDLYLVSLGSAGTACATSYAWINVQGGTASVTDVFGNCRDLVNVSHDAETVMVTLPSSSAHEGFVAFVYDGKTFEEVVLGQEASGIGRAAEDWIGRYPFEVMRDADWRTSLIELMDEDGYRLAGEVIDSSSPFEVQGDWVAGFGFNSRMAGHARGHARGAIALSRNGERVVVAIRTEEGGLQTWGDLSGTMPEAIESVLRSH